MMSGAALTNEECLKETYEPISKTEKRKKDKANVNFKNETDSLREFYKPL